MSSSKITTKNVQEAVAEMRASKKKDRKFVETVELQIALKDYDPQKDKRFVGSVRLPNVPRPQLKICLIADAKHEEEVKKTNVDVDVIDLEALKKFNKDKKLVKAWAKKYALLLASDTVLKKVPVVVGPILNRINRFPQVVTHNVPLIQMVSDVRASVKFQLKKVTCLACAVGRIDMTDEELATNIMMALNFLASLLKKGWHNLKSVVIKTSMGKPIKLL
jgi:large subunit ribosomal protein L10Ae